MEVTNYENCLFTLEKIDMHFGFVRHDQLCTIGNRKDPF